LAKFLYLYTKHYGDDMRQLSRSQLQKLIIESLNEQEESNVDLNKFIEEELRLRNEVEKQFKMAVDTSNGKLKPPFNDPNSYEDANSDVVEGIERRISKYLAASSNPGAQLDVLRSIALQLKGTTGK